MPSCLTIFVALSVVSWLTSLIFCSPRAWTWSLLITFQVREHDLAHNRNLQIPVMCANPKRPSLNDASPVKPVWTPLLCCLRGVDPAISPQVPEGRAVADSSPHPAPYPGPGLCIQGLNTFSPNKQMSVIQLHHL